jgi:hypothetical protein
MATAGTPEDENIENRPKPSSGASVASITLVSMDSEDEEEIEVFQTAAAQIEQTCTEDKKWRNPTKILKRTKLVKRRLAVPKTIQTRDWKPATVTDVTDEDMELDAPIGEAVLVKVEDNPEAACRKQRTPRKRYLNIIRDATNAKAVFDRVMKQPVTIKLQDLLACSPAFTKLLFKTVPVQAEAEVPTASIGSIKSRQRTKQAYAAKTPKLLVKVDRSPTQAMLDTRAEVNVIERAAADELGLPVCTDLFLALKAVSGDTRVFDRACEGVEIDIGGVVNH